MGTYIRLVDYGSQQEKENAFLAAVNENNSKIKFTPKSENFSKIPGSPIAYWVSEKYYSLFLNPNSDSVIDLREGIHTGKNELYLRCWFEISFKKVVINAQNCEDIDKYGRWVPYSKGGAFRKWYGNNELVIGFDEFYRNKMSKESGHVRPSQNLYFKQGATWSALSSGSFGLRLHPQGHLFDSKGQVAIGNNFLEIMGLFNLKAYQKMADMIMPTLDYKCGDVKKLPYCKISNNKFIEIVRENIDISKTDWDSFETSWDFKKNPLL